MELVWDMANLERNSYALYTQENKTAKSLKVKYWQS